jgi:hypothetical protein
MGVDEIEQRARSHMRVQDEIERLERELDRLRQKRDAMFTRDVGIYVEHTIRGKSMRAIAKAYGLHFSVVSRIVAAIEAARDHPGVEARVREAEHV